MHRKALWNVGLLIVLAMAGSVWLVGGYGRQMLEPELESIGDEKAFGLFKPHLHAAVVELLTTDETVEVGAAIDSRRVFVTVRLRSSAAEDPVDPRHLSYVIVSHRGGRYEPAFMVAGNGIRRPWSGPPGPLRPGESLEVSLEYLIPRAMDNPRFWIVEQSWILRYLPWLEETPLFPKLVVPLDSGERSRNQRFRPEMIQRSGPRSTQSIP